MQLLSKILALLIAFFSTATFAQDEFSIWLDEFKMQARVEGISEATITDTLSHVELLPNLIQLDHEQPEFVSPFLEYYYQRVNVKKIVRGREFLSHYTALLDQIEAQYGVPKSLLVAFWGMETDYGAFQGNIDTLSALATLAYEGRRAVFFSHQLLDAMRMIDTGHASVGQLRGSWAGAFGNMQFMPSTFISYAVDGDADGHIDIVNSMADAFASAANYLSKVGWHKGEPAMLEVRLPDNFQWQNAQFLLRKSLSDWEAMGVRLVEDTTSVNNEALKQALVTPIRKNQTGKDKAEKNKAGKGKTKRSKLGKSKVSKHANSTNKKSIESKLQISQSRLATVPSSMLMSTRLADMTMQAAILLPQGRQGPAFMVFDNFHVIMDWNRSVNYALSVAQFAKRINQESRIVGGEFAEAGALTFQQMFELQNDLNLRGFDAGKPDGFPGLQTQAAIRAYQLSQRLPADGYASPSLFASLVNLQ